MPFLPLDSAGQCIVNEMMGYKGRELETSSSRSLSSGGSSACFGSLQTIGFRLKERRAYIPDVRIGRESGDGLD
jgi:hypothetical protein